MVSAAAAVTYYVFCYGLIFSAVQNRYRVTDSLRIPSYRATLSRCVVHSKRHYCFSNSLNDDSIGIDEMVSPSIEASKHCIEAESDIYKDTLSEYRRVNNASSVISIIEPTTLSSNNSDSERSSDSSQMLKRDILRIAAPALAACIAEPALTMVDMYFVGTQRHTVLATRGLAALSVTGSLFNVVAAITYPLCSGTTAMVARIGTGSSEGGRDDADALSSVLVNGLFLATVIGALFTTVIYKYASRLMSIMYGLDPSLLGMTEQYLQVRGLSLPFTLLSYVMVGFCLAVRDASTPMISIGVSSVANIVGDYLLVHKLGLGLLGAAIATSIATVVSSLISISRLSTKYIHYDKDLTVAANVRRWIGLLDLEGMVRFFHTSIALLLGMVADTLTYSAGAKVSSFVPMQQHSLAAYSSMSTANVAAHQVAMQLWWFLSYFSSPISYAAQVMLPKQRAQSKKNITIKLFQISACVATSCTALLAVGLRVCPHLFTSDPIVSGMLESILLPVLISQLFIGLTTALDGVFIGSNRMKEYTAASLLSTAAAWTYYRCVSMRDRLGVAGTWNGLLIFSAVRILFYAARMVASSVVDSRRCKEESMMKSSTVA